MDLKSGCPYWPIKNGLLHNYPPLTKSLTTDILIVGGGITGALICDEFVRAGYQVVVADKRDIGWGSTSASTALLQYEIDTHLVDLISLYGKENGCLAYQKCAESVAALGRLAKEVGDVDFAHCRSLYLASSQQDIEPLRREYQARRELGLDVEFMERRQLEYDFAVSAPVAIVSGQSARVDPFRLTNKLFVRAMGAGAQVFDQSSLEKVRVEKDHVVATFSSKIEVRAQHLIFACGYETQKWLKKAVAKNHSSYAFMSEPTDPNVLAELQNSLIWESARPYLYLRTTGDHRVLVGGEDDDLDLPMRRDKLVGEKTKTLLAQVHRLLPQLNLTPAYSWAGTFAETKDGLPFFGPHPQWGSNVHFAMAYGGNGITYSLLGAELIRAMIEGTAHELSQLFSFDREQLRVSAHSDFDLQNLWKHPVQALRNLTS